MGVSKVVYDGRTLIDLTNDTVEPSKLLKSYTTHGPDGELITGTCEFDANTQDGTATDAEILSGKIAYVKGTKKTGTMKNNGGVTGSISKKSEQYTIPQGYHDGSGKVSISQTEQQKLIPANIRAGVTVLGVTGEMTGTEGAKPQEKSVIPTTSEQVVTPDEGYNYLSQVTVAPIPYVENDNSAGGKTVTIG
jgi:hypothetical protein